MSNKQNVYIVTGLAGIGKSSYIIPKMRDIDENLIVLNVDNLRIDEFFDSYWKSQKTKVKVEDFLEKEILSMGPENKIDGFEGLATLGFIKYHSIFSKGKNLFIESVAFDNFEIIRKLEISEPELNFRVAFIGSSKTARRLKNPEPIHEDSVKHSSIWQKDVGESNLSNYEYFDVMDCVPANEKEGIPIPILKEEYIEKNAKKVIDHLLETAARG